MITRIWLKIESLKIFREAFGLYSSYLANWTTLGESVAKELSKNDRDIAYLTQQISLGNDDYDQVIVGVDEPLVIKMKSLVMYLLETLSRERSRIAAENPPRMAFEAIDAKVLKIQELLKMKVFEGKNVEQLMGPMGVETGGPPPPVIGFITS